MTIYPIEEKDREWVKQALVNLWGSEEMVSRGKLIQLNDLPGFIAEEDGRKVGLVTCRIEGQKCEIVSINSLTPGKGIGNMLLGKVEETAEESGCKKLVVITTNDNQKALVFYEKNGFTITLVRKDIMEEYRKLKPEIPLMGIDGILLTDEIELEKTI